MKSITVFIGKFTGLVRKVFLKCWLESTFKLNKKKLKHGGDILLKVSCIEKQC